jgi:acetyl-CoA carboxylase biotin carboxyl carrier protein
MDMKQIKALVQLMVDNDLSRIELREGETHILLRRGQPPVLSSMVPAPLTTLPGMPAPSGAGRAKPAEPDEELEPDGVLIRSPMVGTFYASADPESPPFAQIGDEVQPDTVVCLVEAMKVFNEIKAEVSGRIKKVLVQNAQAVEYDQPLFVVASS